jgi:hypothetical protein
MLSVGIVGDPNCSFWRFCVPVFVASARTSSVECIGGCSARDGACVDRLGGFFCVRNFFLAGVLPPSWPWLLLVLALTPLVPIWCVGAGLPCV